ncbi:543_t:CDS:2 [Ambispora gerdemannii]|uniref:543_t:CDS:1 n=1 Tax=Ambispora gerdemannii TaxID=144530 RepID=A0A9N9C7X4_9GLOM|nr:543_t:CDS:2 [Ambispora gerdemannii]
MINPSINYAYLTDVEMQLLQQCAYQLTLSLNELTKSAVKKRRNPPRPQNSWIIFRRDYEAYLRLCNQNVKSKVKETAKECSLKWRNLSSEVKHFFKILEKIACENHKRTYPNYKYKPKHAKNTSHKEFIFREQKKYVSISPTKLSTITSNSPQEPIQINRPPYLIYNSPQETIQIYEPPSLTSNSPQEPIQTQEPVQIDSSPSLTSNSPKEPIQIDRLPFLTLAIYNNQDYTNNFTTGIYNQQDYSNDFTTTIYNQQDYTTAIYNQQDYTNDLAQNSLDNTNFSSLKVMKISSPLTQSQSLTQLFMTKYDSCHF